MSDHGDGDDGGGDHGDGDDGDGGGDFFMETLKMVKYICQPLILSSTKK